MKEFTGKVTSTSMQKTIVVTVVRQWTHPKYKKTIKSTNKYLVHDEKEQAKMNDNVIFLDSAEKQSIIASALSNQHTVPTGGTHDFFVNDTVTPKFTITENSIESNVKLNLICSYTSY